MAWKVICELLEHYNRIAGIEKRTVLAVRFFAFADKAHDVGDKYLESFAVLLKGLPREHCLVSRRSGDEFCIFICGFSDVRDIQMILKELWRKLREEEAVITQDVIRRIRASGGVAYARGQRRAAGRTNAKKLKDVFDLVFSRGMRYNKKSET